MLQAPINYGALQQQLDFTPLTQGLQIRDQRQQFEAQQQVQQERVQLAKSQFDAKQAADEGYRTALSGYLADPTPEALLAISSRFPDHQEALSKGAEAYNTSQRNDLVTAAASTLGALSAGKTDIAIKTLEERRAGLRRAGINDAQTSAVIDLVKQGKTKEAQAYLGYALSGLIGPQHASSVLQTLGVGAKAENDDRRLDIQERRAAAAEEAANARLSLSERAADRADRAAARADRKAAGGGGSGGFETKIINGKLYKRPKQ